MLCLSGCSRNTFQMLFTGLWVISDICALPCVRFCLSLAPGIWTDSLKIIRAQVISSSRPFKIHLLPGTDVIVTVRSSIKALMDGCLTLDLVSGPLHSTSAAFTSMFMAREKRITEMVPVMIPFLSLCHAEVVVILETFRLKLLLYSRMRFVNLPGIW